MPRVTDSGIKAGELFSARDCMLSLNPGVRLRVRKRADGVPMGTGWYVAKYGVTGRQSREL